LGPERAITTVGAEWYNWRYDLLATNASGNSVLVGEQGGTDGDDGGVFASRMDAAGNAVGDVFQVNTFTQYAQDDPSVGIDAAGNFLIAWQSFLQDGGKPGIYAQRYNAAGQRIGGEF
jgi:hypothetical protein